jgi:hypothetical protein
MSDTKKLLYNIRFYIAQVVDPSGTGKWPAKQWIVSGYSASNSLDNHLFPEDALENDVLILSNRNRYLYKGAVEGQGFLFQSHPWSDQTEDEYYILSSDTGLLFRESTCLKLLQHGSASLGIPEQLVQFINEKAKIQLEEKIRDDASKKYGTIGSVCMTKMWVGNTVSGKTGEYSFDISAAEFTEILSVNADALGTTSTLESVSTTTVTGTTVIPNSTVYLHVVGK